MARMLSGRARLPGRAKMHAQVQDFYDLLQRSGVPVRYTHCQVEASLASVRTLLPASAERLLRLPPVRLCQRYCCCPLNADWTALLQGGGAPYDQVAYNAFLARASGPNILPTEEWRLQLSDATSGAILAQPDTFRDVWPDEDLPLYAAADAACEGMLQKHEAAKARRLAAGEPL